MMENHHFYLENSLQMMAIFSYVINYQRLHPSFPETAQCIQCIVVRRICHRFLSPATSTGGGAIGAILWAAAFQSGAAGLMSTDPWDPWDQPLFFEGFEMGQLPRLALFLDQSRKSENFLRPHQLEINWLPPKYDASLLHSEPILRSKFIVS